MDWSSVSQNVVLVGGFLVTGLASVYRFAGHGRRMAKREHDVVRRLRQRDLEEDDPRHNLNLQAWYTDLTGERYVRPAEIRHLATFNDIQGALTFYASARSNLKLVEFQKGKFRLVMRSRWAQLAVTAISHLMFVAAMLGMFVPIALGILGETKGGLPLPLQAFFVVFFGAVWALSIPGLRFAQAVKRVLQLQGEGLAPGERRSRGLREGVGGLEDGGDGGEVEERQLGAGELEKVGEVEGPLIGGETREGGRGPRSAC